MKELLIITGISILIGLISGLIVRKSGYSFLRYFITGFIASLGILTLLYKILRDYIQ